MSDDYVALIDRARSFFTDLAANNDKAWFEPRKEIYAAEIRKPAERLADAVGARLAALTGQAHRAKVFRIHRDVRFSRDKSPYNPHLHIAWNCAGGKEAGRAWFFGAAPDYLILGTGFMGLTGAALDRYRALVDARGAEIEAALAEAAQVGGTLSDWGPEPLKRVPKPYAPDHPQGDLLRRKALAVAAPLPEAWREVGVLAALDRVAGGLLPLWRILGAADQPG